MSLIHKIDNPERVLNADIVVGIPSYKEADSIAFPTSVADQGLQESFPDSKCVIVNVDNHSPDGTREAFLATRTKTPKIYATTSPEQRGKGRNILNLFEISAELGAEAIVMVDADLKSITPQWIEYLCRPILLDDYDYVNPIYVRHKYDGTITNNIAYPLLRTLYGLRLRQPIGGDFGISGSLARCFLIEKSRTEEVEHFGIDIWMTTIAIARRFKIAQTFMGTPKSHRPKDPGADLGPMFSQVVSTIFQLVIDFEYIWKETGFSRPSIIYGFGLGQSAEVPEVKVNRERLLESFLTGFQAHKGLWEEVLHPSQWKVVEHLTTLDVDKFFYKSDVWARILFDFCVAYRDRESQRQALIDALIPFYHSRTLSFVNKTVDMDTQAAELYLENINRVFEQEKSYFVDRWDRTRRGGTGVAARLLRG